MLSVKTRRILLSVRTRPNMLRVVMLNVVMLSVVRQIDELAS
jgi:hypothetical protein